MLGRRFGVTVQTDRLNRARFVQQIIAGSVHRTAAGEDEAAHTGRLGQFGQHASRDQIDIDRQFFIQVAGWVAHDGTQVNDRIDALHGLIGSHDVLKVAFDYFEIGVVKDLPDGLPAEHQDVEQSYFVSLLEK